MSTAIMQARRNAEKVAKQAAEHRREHLRGLARRIADGEEIPADQLDGVDLDQLEAEAQTVTRIRSLAKVAAKDVDQLRRAEYEARAKADQRKVEIYEEIAKLKAELGGVGREAVRLAEEVSDIEAARRDLRRLIPAHLAARFDSIEREIQKADAEARRCVRERAEIESEPWLVRLQGRVQTLLGAASVETNTTRAKHLQNQAGDVKAEIEALQSDEAQKERKKTSRELKRDEKAARALLVKLTAEREELYAEAARL